MADVKYTKGPWFVGGGTGLLNQLAIEPSIGCAYGAGDEVKANALLMAAAPDLLESLRAFVSPWDGDSVEEIESQSGLATSVRIEKARAAIAKAVQS